ncbi:hypothetical protein OHS70_13455 [Streptomyces sp. NBC_00390]|uniref:hypothetical protein n=1 Tax=Streptomyces sp. NBC_00390 TaxID=2975736 RepID=UPI002E23DCD8
MSPVTEAHSEADDSIRLQLAGESGLHVTRDKDVLPEMDGRTPEPEITDGIGHLRITENELIARTLPRQHRNHV